MPKVLLSSVFKPFGVDNEIDNSRILPELFEAQVTFAQNLFSLRSVYYSWGLELIALNIEAPTTVMHYPSLKEFEEELKKGYDYVGITCVTPTFGKAKMMVESVRRVSPKSKVIIGGYGSVLPEAEKIADHVCREEGVTFMRRLLGEPKKSGPFEIPLAPTRTKILGIGASRGAVLFLSLGCPNGCDFCNTSHFFNRKRIPLISDAFGIYNELLRIERELGITDFGVIDEDFLLQKDMVRELAGHLSRRDARPFTFSCFASARAISFYSPEELLKLGVDTIWLGIESKRSHFDKLKGVDLEKTIRSLQDAGINVLGSFILGLEHHDEENLREDFEEFISLRPTLSQFLISTPNPRTPLHARLENEGRLHPLQPLKNDGFNLVFNHPNFRPERLKELQMQYFNEDYERLGPSIFRFIEIQLRGYRNLKGSKDPAIRKRVALYKDKCRKVYPMIPVGIKYAPNENIRKWIKGLSAELYSEFGKPSISDRAKTAVALASAAYHWKRRNVNKPNNPKTIVKRYRH